MGEKKDKGKIIIRKSKKGRWVFEIDLGTKQPMTIPSFYDLKDDSLNGKECEVIREKGQIKEILVDGRELPKKEQVHKKNYHNRQNNPHQKNRIFANNNSKTIVNLYSIRNAKLPEDTKQLLDSVDIDNFYLKLNRCVNFSYNKEKGKEETVLYKNEYKDKNDNNKLKKFEIEFNFNKWESIIKKIDDDFSNLKTKLVENGYKIKNRSFTPDWRLIVGLGNPSVYETSITLHHIYGIPYIPGSAVKGVVRSYFIKSSFEETGCKWEEINIFERILETLDTEKDKILEYEGKEEGGKKIKDFKSRFSTKDTKDPKDLYRFFYKESRLKEEIKALILKFRTIFGTQAQQGKIIFFDAFPNTKPKLEIDIMNPHYGPYYGQKKNDNIPPADYLNPVPIYFLTVADTEFEFIVGAKKEGKNKLDEAMCRLKQALMEHGIGAKTAVGYGYMKRM